MSMMVTFNLALPIKQRDGLLSSKVLLLEDAGDASSFEASTASFGAKRSTSTASATPSRRWPFWTNFNRSTCPSPAS
eukprot:Skav209114  [mRNA]  locus=scaffold179:259107:263058:- [translate_table: standard]